MNNPTKSKLSRRNFLLAAGAGGVAAVAAVASRTVSTEEPKAVAGNDDKRRGKGYQETAHVRSYYNTTKV
jgi:secreted PhoX family phosphatase